MIKSRWRRKNVSSFSRASFFCSNSKFSISKSACCGSKTKRKIVSQFKLSYYLIFHQFVFIGVTFDLSVPFLHVCFAIVLRYFHAMHCLVHHHGFYSTSCFDLEHSDLTAETVFLCPCSCPVGHHVYLYL